MTRPTELLLLGRYFWPLGSFDSAGHLRDIATGLNRRGFRVDVATPRFQPNGAELFQFREYLVHRPLRIFKTGWSARSDRSPGRFITQLRKWIIERFPTVDAILCCGAREEMIAGGEAAQKLGVPLIVFLGSGGEDDDQQFFHQSRMGARCGKVASSADAVIVSDAASQRTWISGGGDPDRTHKIRIGVGGAVTRDGTTRQTLRSALAKINADLRVDKDMFVGLSVERMTKRSGLNQLVESAYKLCSLDPQLQLWLIGDGPRRDAIYGRLRSDGIRQSIAMPGSFGQLEDVMVSADAMIHSGKEGFYHQIPLAISAGLPLVLANHSTSRSFFDVSAADVGQRLDGAKKSQSGEDRDPENQSIAGLIHWFDEENSESLQRALRRVKRDRERSLLMANELRKRLRRTRPQHLFIDQVGEVIRSTLASSVTGATESTTERV